MPGCATGILAEAPVFQWGMTTATRNAAQTILLLVALAVFWLACVANLTKDDMIVGAGAVALSVAFCFFVVRTLPLHFRPTLRDLLELWRLPADVAIDVVQITLVLVRDLLGNPAPSLFRATSWNSVDHDGRSVARRTLAIAGTTISPNFIVVGIDSERRQMLFHQVKDSPVPRMTQRLGAGAGR